MRVYYTKKISFPIYPIILINLNFSKKILQNIKLYLILELNTLRIAFFIEGNIFK